MSWSREKTLFGFDARNQSSSNSLAVSWSGSPSRSTSCFAASITSAPTATDVRGGTPGRIRRNTVFTRVASSRGENGFVT
jgi:hypothetical protein